MSWSVVALGEVATLQAGVGFPPALQGRETGEIPFAKVGDISALARSGGDTLVSARNHVSREEVKALRARPIPVGSTLFAKIGEAISQNFRVLAGTDVLIDNNAMAAIPSETIDARYLYRFLQTVDMYELASSTTVPALRKSDLERVSVPLPPLPEQRRIASILDRASEARQLRFNTMALLKEFDESALVELLSPAHPDTVSTTVGTVAHVQTGPFGSLLHAHDYEVGGIPVINPKHIVRGRISPESGNAVSAATASRLSTFTLCAGDVVLARRGEMGRAAVVRESDGPLLCGTGSMILRPKPGVILGSVLAELMSGRAVKDSLERRAQGVTMLNINQSIVVETALRVPSMRRQLAFAESQHSSRAMVETRLAHVSKLDELFASLQHRAFNGEL